MRKGTDKDWEQRAGCMTFPEAVAKESQVFQFCHENEMIICNGNWMELVML